MKLSKKILLIPFAMLMVTTSMLGFNKNDNRVKAELDDDEIVLPSAVTNSIYRYARAIGDSPDKVDNALIEWLSNDDNLSGLPLFKTIPEEFDAKTNRKIKDSFYAITYMQQYAANGTIENKDPTTTIRIILDYAMPAKDDLVAFVDFESDGSYEDAYYACESLYYSVYDAIIDIQRDVNCINYQPVERFVSNAKRFLQAQIDEIDNIGFDENLNKYSYFKSVLKGFGTSIFMDPSYNEEYSTKIIDYILFDENTHIDTYFSNEFIDFTLDEYNLAVSEATTFEEFEQISAPYIEKLDRQLFAYLVTFNFASSTYINDAESVKEIVNNYGPLCFKLLDYREAKVGNDSPNIVILSFEIMEDLQLLMEHLGLNINKQDLNYEKYIANMRLGSLAYNEKTIYKFAKFLSNMNEINKVSVISSATYEAGVQEINRLLNDAYKDMNVDIIPTSEQAVLFFANGLEELASREQAYSFEIRKMLNHDHAFPIQGRMMDDYGDNMLYVSIIWIDMVLTDKNTNEELYSLENPLDVVFGIYNLQIGTDVRIYRYDERKDKVVSLEDEPTESGTDYFELNIDDVTVHTKEFGTFAITYINRLIKEEVENFRSEIKDLKEQIATLNNELIQKDGLILQLENRIMVLEQQVFKLKADLTIKQALIDGLQTELDLTKASLNDKIRELNKLQQDLQTKNILSAVFIVSACAFATATIVFVTLYILERKKK